MNQLQIFSNTEFGTIRTLEMNGDPWFVGKDVAEALGYANPRDAISKHVDTDDKGVAKCDTLGGTQEFTTINESGVYALVFGSKLESAKRFKHWVTSEVLPSIRKHGAYMTPETLEKALLNPDGMITVLKALKAEQEKRKALESENKQMQPKALFADAVTASETSTLIRDFAKILRQNGVDMGEKRLYKWFRDNGYIIKNSTEPTQRAMEMGLFERIERTVQRGDKPPLVTSTTRITGRGQVYFTNKFLAG